MYGRTVESVELGDSWCWCIELSWPELSIVLSNWSTVVVWKLVPYSMSPFSGRLCDCKLQETKGNSAIYDSNWLAMATVLGPLLRKKQRWPWFEPLQGSGLFPGGTIGAMVGLNTSKFPYTEISWLMKWVCDPYMVWMDLMLLLLRTIGCSMTCWHDCGNLNKLWATSIDQVNESWWNQFLCGLACCQIAGTDSIPSWWKESGQPDSLQTVKRAMTLAGQSESYWHTWWSTNGLVTPLWKVQVGLWKTTGSI